MPRKNPDSTASEWLITLRIPSIRSWARAEGTLKFLSLSDCRAGNLSGRFLRVSEPMKLDMDAPCKYRNLRDSEAGASKKAKNRVESTQATQLQAAIIIIHSHVNRDLLWPQIDFVRASYAGCLYSTLACLNLI